MGIYQLPDETVTTNIDEYRDKWLAIINPIVNAVPDSTVHKFGYGDTSYQVEILHREKIVPMTAAFAIELCRALRGDPVADIEPEEEEALTAMDDFSDFSDLDDGDVQY